MIISRCLFSLVFSTLVILSIFDIAYCNPVPTEESDIYDTAMRTILADTGLVLRASRTFDIISPNHLASAALREFYRSILADVLFEWRSNRPELSSLSITRGPFVLTFIADTLEHTVPWYVIGQFCSHMIDWTTRGYLATFDRGYWNLEGSFGVYVGLRFAPGRPFH